PRPVPAEIMQAQNQLLASEVTARGVVDGARLPSLADEPRITLWKGDITQLRVTAIVNAANPQLLGCFWPLHRCIDNAIHSAAGMGLREECARIMSQRGRPEPAGTATLTGAYCLPALHVVHTVGPVVRDRLTSEHEGQLASCYTSCLEAAVGAGCSTIAFCCISTGEYGYPKDKAADVAVGVVSDCLPRYPTIRKVIFNVFTSDDEAIYRKLLGPDG
ncbi:MAG: macro domain-containing protein, partial [Propionibacteriaceae bacterium]|nr:macro domain-containing protein [Propionibacteriaceae bacterium]